uniref:Leucine-rich repeat-containing N-terminal plant-type domain-containing protein n=1 Tax=Auxenochlorella protothecoides TaxID=3075 RepID=A0A1D1ZSU1_AUXPR
MQRLVALLVGALFELSQVSGSYVNREHFAPSTESVLMQMLSLSSRGTKICPQPTCGVGECSWPGVSCEKGKVVELTLPGAGLRMQFPSNMFSLSELRVLDLRNNELVGPLPAAMPLQLTTINLAHNDLSGTIPQSWASLPHLQRVWLQGNRIDGPLPAGWQEDCGALAVGEWARSLRWHARLPGVWRWHSSEELQHSKPRNSTQSPVADGPTLPEAPSLVLVCVSTVQHQKDSSEREDALASVLTTPAAPAAAHGSSAGVLCLAILLPLAAIATAVALCTCYRKQRAPPVAPALPGVEDRQAGAVELHPRKRGGENVTLAASTSTSGPIIVIMPNEKEWAIASRSAGKPSG